MSMQLNCITGFPWSLRSSQSYLFYKWCLQNEARIPSCGADFKYTPRAVGYSHISYVTIAPLGMFYPTGWQSNLKGY